VFDRLENFDLLLNEGIISNYFLFKWRGAVFDGIANSGDRIAGFTLTADSLDELSHKHNVAVRDMRVIDVNGNDIMRHDLLTEIKYDLI
jgi:hypothetical protein